MYLVDPGQRDGHVQSPSCVLQTLWLGMVHSVEKQPKEASQQRCYCPVWVSKSWEKQGRRVGRVVGVMLRTEDSILRNCRPNQYGNTYRSDDTYMLFENCRIGPAALEGLSMRAPDSVRIFSFIYLRIWGVSTGLPFHLMVVVCLPSRARLSSCSAISTFLLLGMILLHFHFLK